MRRSLALGAAVLLAVSGCSVGSNTGGSSGGDQEITFLTFETPNLTPAYWDAAIKRVTDKNPGIKVKKLVAPTADGRTSYAKQLLQSGQFPDVMIAVDSAGFAEAGNLYAWTPEELKDFQFPDADPVKGKYYQLPANTQTIPPVYYNKKMFADAGITATPKTWAELQADAGKLKDKGLAPFTIGGGKDGFPSSMILSGLVST
jgi:ABC-type glycerol-3-phosphate transport system substrate-binding protein